MPSGRRREKKEEELKVSVWEESIKEEGELWFDSRID